MHSYRAIFRVPEFGALFGAVSLTYAADAISGLALATLVYAHTGSPLLAAMSMFGASFAQMIGALTLLSTADRVRPRAALTSLFLVFAAATFVLAVPGLPVWAILAVVLLTGLPRAMAGGVQWGLMDEIVPADGYVLGRSVFNMANGVMQVLGFATGGALLHFVSARGALLISVGLYLAAVAVTRFGLTGRPPRSRERPSVRETWSVNRRLWSSRPRRDLYLAMWVPNGLIVGCVALFVPYSPAHASILFASEAFGMLLGDTLVGRFVPSHRRAQLVTPLRLLLAAPYLLLALQLPTALAAIAVAMASVGYGAGLLLQERLVALSPDDARGQALGLHSSGMLTMQAVGALVAGALAEQAGAATAIGILAAASLAVTVVLTPRLRRDFERAKASPGSTRTRVARL